MNFIPNPGHYNKKDFNNDLDDYFRRIMLRAHFGNNEPNIYEGYTNPTNNQWTPREIHHSVKTYIQAVKNDIVAHTPEPQCNRKQNLTHGEKQALATLKERDDLIISKADKGGAVVLQNVTDYLLPPTGSRAAATGHGILRKS